MHGYTCDRCHTHHPGGTGHQLDRGPHLPPGWTGCATPDGTRHLCENCTLAFYQFLDDSHCRGTAAKPPAGG